MDSLGSSSEFRYAMLITFPKQAWLILLILLLFAKFAYYEINSFVFITAKPTHSSDSWSFSGGFWVTAIT